VISGMILTRNDNYFTRVLKKKYNVELSEDPDLFFSRIPTTAKGITCGINATGFF
jgi:hypothetical protein